MDAVKVKIAGTERLLGLLDIPLDLSVLFDDPNNEIRNKIQEALNRGETVLLRKPQITPERSAS